MQAASYDFEVTRDPWISTSPILIMAALDMTVFHDWGIFQGRYTLCLLFEYASTLGLIDVAYVPPAGIPPDFQIFGAQMIMSFSAV